MHFKTRIPAMLLLVFPLLSAPALADTVRIAAAANFTAAMKEISRTFEQASGHKTVVSYGSTGKLYTQIGHGAPFDIFLAADQTRPSLLEQKNKASNRFTYAIGKLVLWTKKEDLSISAQHLRNGEFKKLSIANPKTAPYGAAAIQILKNLGIYYKLEPKLVIGDNIAQTYQFAATGNAELGFIALAQIALKDQGSRWHVPPALYTPIRQDAVLLNKATNNPAAIAFLEFLKSDAAKSVIQKYGYATE